MTLDELDKLLAGKTTIRQNGALFFNTRSQDEADHFRSLGAHERPFPSYCPGAEVHFRLLADEEPDVVRAHFAKRDAMVAKPSIRFAA